jgi:protein-tyrosine-phosphatase
MLGPGVAPPPEAVAALAHYGLDISGHRSRYLEADDVRSADLVVCMARSHVREAVVLVPDAWPRTFTLKELVRRASEVGLRRPGEGLATWLARVGEGRVQSELLGDADVDDVDDPLHGAAEDYLATAALLEELVDRLVTLAWPARWLPGARAPETLVDGAADDVKERRPGTPAHRKPGGRSVPPTLREWRRRARVDRDRRAFAGSVARPRPY